MASMDTDLVTSLTQEGVTFEANWASFMFNMDQAQQLKMATAEQVLAVLQAGAGFQGSGWSTGRASRVLYELTGTALVKAHIEPYRDVWLYALALMCGVNLPNLEMP